MVEAKLFTEAGSHRTDNNDESSQFCPLINTHKKYRVQDQVSVVNGSGSVEVSPLQSFRKRLLREFDKPTTSQSLTACDVVLCDLIMHHPFCVKTAAVDLPVQKSVTAYLLKGYSRALVQSS